MTVIHQIKIKKKKKKKRKKTKRKSGKLILKSSAVGQKV